MSAQSLQARVESRKPASPHRDFLPKAMFLRRLLLTLATALALLWPAFVNGGSFWFPDTSNYIRSADAATVVLTGVPTEWSNRLRLGEDGPLATAAKHRRLESAVGDLKPTRPVLTGRSIYYGFLIYLPRRVFGPEAAIVLQAILVAGILVFCGQIALRVGAVRRPARLLAALAVVVVLSPLPFYTSMLMPDVYAGLMILMLAMAMCYWPRLTDTEKVVLLLASGVIASFHTTHLLIACAMGVLGAILGLAHKTTLRPLVLVIPVIAIAVLGSAVFSYAVTKSLNEKPISPPFLSARLTSAGPGTAYLETACARDADAWALCAYRAKLPVGSDDFLWTDASEVAVFQAANSEEQRRMAREDKSFAAAVVLSDPLGVVGTTVGSAFAQLVSFDLKNFNYSPAHRAMLETKYPKNVAAQIATTRAANGTMPTGFALSATIAATVLSLALLAYWAVRSFGSRYRRASLEMQLVALLVLSVFANAVVCGGLSGPHARYQMRLIWLLPITAIAFVQPNRRGRALADERRPVEVSK